MSRLLACAAALTTIAALTLLTTAPVRADVLLQTATLGPTGQDSGVFITGGQLVGIRFQTNQTFNLTSVQIHALTVVSGNRQLFAAIVPLTDMDAFPIDLLIANDNPVEFQTFAAPDLSAVITIPFSASLPAGTYAVVFGSGEFGATGVGILALDNTQIGTPSYFFKSGAGFFSGVITSPFIVVNGTASAAEPGSLVLLLLSALPFAGLVKTRRHRLCGKG